MQLDYMRHRATQIVAARLSRAEPPLRKEVVEYMLDVGFHMFSLRRSNGLLLLDSEFNVKGRWEKSGHNTLFGYNFGYQSRQHTMISSSWRVPTAFKTGFDLQHVQDGPYGRHLHVYDWPLSILMTKENDGSLPLGKHELALVPLHQVNAVPSPAMHFQSCNGLFLQQLVPVSLSTQQDHQHLNQPTVYCMQSQTSAPQARSAPQVTLLYPPCGSQQPDCANTEQCPRSMVVQPSYSTISSSQRKHHEVALDYVQSSAMSIPLAEHNLHHQQPQQLQSLGNGSFAPQPRKVGLQGVVSYKVPGSALTYSNVVYVLPALNGKLTGLVLFGAPSDIKMVSAQSMSGELNNSFDAPMISAGREGGQARSGGTGTTLSGWKDFPMELLLWIISILGDDRKVIVAYGVCTGWRDALGWGVTNLSLSWCQDHMSDLVISLAHKFTKLQVLSLRQIKPQLEDSAVETVANSCHDLRELDPSKSFRLSDLSLYALAHGCLHLTRLNISGCSNFSDTAWAYLINQCKNLQHLNLCGCGKAATDRALQTIACNYGQLQPFNLGWCASVTDMGVTSLASGCPELRVVDLCGRVLITDESVVALANGCPHLRRFIVQGGALAVHGLLSSAWGQAEIQGGRNVKDMGLGSWLLDRTAHSVEKGNTTKAKE